MEKLSASEKLIYALKYQGREDIGVFLAEQSLQKYSERWLNMGIEAIVCVPLHPKRKKQRGYNQCHSFCFTLSKRLQIPFYPNAIARVHYQSSQTQMNRLARWENVHLSFRITNISAVKSKNILLVDDVLTTGATLEACVATIKKYGKTKVHIFTMACKI